MPDDDVHPPLVVVMGVSGSGKTTVGRALAARLGVVFEDGDDLHPEANVAKMSRGEPLDDADRFPWLERVGEWLAAQESAGTGGVVACSALKRRYRDQLRGHASDVDLLLLTAEQDVLSARLRERHGHFMPAGLLSSQLATLEPLQPDERGRVIHVDQPVDAVVEQYLREVEEDR